MDFGLFEGFSDEDPRNHENFCYGSSSSLFVMQFASILPPDRAWGPQDQLSPDDYIVQ